MSLHKRQKQQTLLKQCDPFSPQPTALSEQPHLEDAHHLLLHLPLRHEFQRQRLEQQISFDSNRASPFRKMIITTTQTTQKNPALTTTPPPQSRTSRLTPARRERPPPGPSSTHGVPARGLSTPSVTKRRPC